jgi:lipid II:glycine glycyltransferase (peptidoglycan interpeptide bridge formation enzyme)
MDLSLCRDATTWDSLVASHPFGHPLQCWGWGEVKAATGWQADRLALYDSGNLRAAAQVLTRRFPGLPVTMTYVPRGPVVSPSDTDALRALARALKEHGRRRRSLFCKVDPAWTSTGDEERLGAAGFVKSGETVQVTDTYTIDLRQSEDEILAGMRSKTRQYIRKAEREETAIVRDISGEYLSACYQVYEETARRAGFGLHPRDYYETLFRSYLADRQYLYVAIRQGEVLSFLWMVCAGPFAVEFYGGVSNAGQEWKSNYLLKWHAIREMKATGYQVYDLNGRVNEGIAQFKQGFGPATTSWVGPYDAVYHSVLYSAWKRGLPLARRLARRSGGSQVADGTSLGAGVT